MKLALSRLPGPLAHLIHTRLASSSTASQGTHGSFPFPTHANPTPHEIFHLPPGSSQKEIKIRYYELVRLHHPDCATARFLPPSTSHSRFQAISDAYAVLSGQKPSSSPSSRPWDRDMPYEEELRRRRTRARWRASASSDEFGTSTWENENRERWDQQILIFIVVFTLSCAILPLSLLSPFAGSSFSDRRHVEAQKNLANARKEAKELAKIRRDAAVQRKSTDGSEPVHGHAEGSGTLRSDQKVLDT